MGGVHGGVIHYFGADPSDTRQLILRQAGYTLHVSKPSIDNLLQALRDPDLSAVLLADLPETSARQFAEAIHSNSPAPVVLFAANTENDSLFDCVIPPLTHPAEWLDLVAKCVATCARSRSLVTEAAKLQSDASALVTRSRDLRQHARRLKRTTDQMQKE